MVYSQSSFLAPRFSEQCREVKFTPTATPRAEWPIVWNPNCSRLEVGWRLNDLIARLSAHERWVLILGEVHPPTFTSTWQMKRLVCPSQRHATSHWLHASRRA